MENNIKKLSFPDFLNLFKIEDATLCNITSMIGGKYHIPKTHYQIFYSKYEKYIKSKLYHQHPVYLQEKIPKTTTKLFIDIDCKTEEDSQAIIDKFKTVILDTFNVLDVSFSIQCNSVYSSKKHVFALSSNKNILVAPFVLEYITFNVESDMVHGLRMPGSYKKEGISKGVYNLGNGKSISDYSLLFHKEESVCRPTCKLSLYNKLEVWYNSKNPKLEKNNSKYISKELSTNQEDLDKQIDWLLEKILLNNPKALNNYISWWNIVNACKNLNYDCSKLNEYCKKIPGYEDDTGVIEQYEKRHTTKKTIGTLIYYISDDIEKGYDTLKKEFFRSFVTIQKGGGLIPNEIKKLYEEGTNYSCAKLFFIMKKDDVKVIDSNNLEACAISWNKDKLLWEIASKSMLAMQITKVCDNLSNDIKEDINKRISAFQKGSEEYNSLDKYRKLILSIDKKYKSWNFVCSAVNYFLQLNEAKDYKFRTIIDSDIYSLPISNRKIVYLKTGETRLRTKEDYFSEELNLDIGDSKNENVNKYFMGLANNDLNLYMYLQEVCGYALSGSQNEKCIFLIYGERDCGKSEFIRILAEILKKYFFTTDNLLVKGRKIDKTGADPELASIQGKRVISKVETDKFQNLDEPLIKKISGGDDITARFLHCNTTTFKPIGKIFIATNYQPNFDFTDNALTQRLRYIEFKNKFEKTTENIEFIENIYKNHINDIFAWMVEGSKRYFSINKLNIPKECVESQKEEISEQDDFRLWASSAIKPKPGVEIKGTIVYQRYKDDMLDNGLHVDSIKLFYLKCKSMNYHVGIKDGYRLIYGIDLVPISITQDESSQSDNKI